MEVFMKENIRQNNLRDTDNINTAFEVMVYNKQNATWQGRIQWIDQKQKQNFRSELEMLKLMNEALSEGETEEEPAGWKE